MKNVTLILDDGSRFQGKSFGYEKPVSGEVVFNTAMMGYPECLTDPSYKGQILVLTYPVIGNYGVPPLHTDESGLAVFVESDKIHASALIVTDYSEIYSHWNAKESLGEWLNREQSPAITGIDTRELTKVLREKGVMNGKIVFEGDTCETCAAANEAQNLVEQVSCKEVIRYNEGASKKVVVVDCGIMHSLMHSLKANDVEIIRVPWNFDFNTIEFDGLFLSNGPGDPAACTTTIENVKKFMANKSNCPCIGVGLGHQIMALAAGAEVYKMKYGHHSHNQPIRKAGTNTCYITDQNHGYAVESESLSADWKVTFTNLNDGSNEGIKHNTSPWFGVQFLPETINGPIDAEFSIEGFIKSL